MVEKREIGGGSIESNSSNRVDTSVKSHVEGILWNKNEINTCLTSYRLNQNLNKKNFDLIFDSFLEKAKSDDNFAENIVPALINTWNISEEKLNSSFDLILRESKNRDSWSRYIFPVLIKTWKISEDKLNSNFESVLQEAKHNTYLAIYVVPELINTWRISEEKLRFLDNFFDFALKEARTNQDFAIYIIPALINTWKIPEEKLNSIFESSLEEAKDNEDWAKYIIPLLINTWKISEEKLNSIFESSLEEAKTDYYWTIYIVPVLINTWKISEDKLNSIFDTALEETKVNENWSEYIIPELLNTWKISEEKLNSSFDLIFRESKNRGSCSKYIFPALIKTWKISEDKLNSIFESSLKEAKINENWAEYIIPELIKTWKISEDKLNSIFESSLKEAKINENWAEYIIPELIKALKISEEKLELLDDFFDFILEEAKSNDVCARYVFLPLLNTWKIPEKKLKLIDGFFSLALEKAKNDYFRREYIIPLLLNTWKISEEKLNSIFESSLEEAKDNEDWTEHIALALINTWKISKEKLNSVFELSLEEAKTNYFWAEYIVPALINTWKISEEKLKLLDDFFDFILEEAKVNGDLAEYVIPELINTWKISEEKLKLLDDFFYLVLENTVTYDDYQSTHAILALLKTWKVLNFTILEHDEEFLLNYKRNNELFDSIFNKLNQNFKILTFLNKNFLNLEILEKVNKFLEKYQVNTDIFWENIEKILQNENGMEIWYFLECIKKEENLPENYPINTTNFTNYIKEENEVIFSFEKDEWLTWETKPWTKKWFLENTERKNYLKKENYKTIKKFGTIIWIWLLWWCKDKKSLEKFYKYIFSSINIKKSRTSLLQLWEIFNLILRKEDYSLLDELVWNKVEIWKCFKNFVEQYKISDKWKTILTLLITREIRDSYQIFNNKNWDQQIDYTSIERLLLSVYKKLEKYKKVIEIYKNIPVKTSIWIEIEVTQSISEAYKELNQSDYKNDIEIISDYSWISSWNDAVHEICTKPTDNPYLLILEIQLLQDLDFLDLNFKKEWYDKWSRWLHITIWWEKVEMDEESNFIQNILSLSNIWSVNSWEEINKVNYYWSIRWKGGLEDIYWNMNWVEFRSLSIDKFEQFERMIISTFNLFMLKQLSSIKEINKWKENWILLKLKRLLSKQTKIKNLKKLQTHFKELKTKIKRTIENHNKYFLRNESLNEWLDKNIENLLKLFISTWPVIELINKLNLSIWYLRSIWDTEIKTQEEFEQRLNKDWKDIYSLWEKQRKILYMNYKIRIKPNLEKIRKKDEELYNNIWKYLNWNLDETLRKLTNRSRFLEVCLWDEKKLLDYIESIKIEPEYMYEKMDEDLSNKFIRINNLFIKKDSVNAIWMLTTTKEEDWVLVDLLQTELSIYDKLDRWIEPRKWYNVIQWASEDMLVHSVAREILECNRLVLEYLN